MMHKSVGTLGAVWLGAALAAGPAAAKTKLVISNWDAYMPPDLIERFTAATGIEAEVAVHATNEEIMGKVTASGGQGYDVLFVSSPFAEALHKLELIAPIDHAKVPNLAGLTEAQELAHDPGNTFSVPYPGAPPACAGAATWCRTPHELERPAQARGRAQGQDHHARDRPLASGRRLPGAGTFGQHHGPGRDRRRQGPPDRGQAHAARLRRHHLLFQAGLRRASLVHAWDRWCNYGIGENPAIRFAVPEEGSDL